MAQFGYAEKFAAVLNIMALKPAAFSDGADARNIEQLLKLFERARRDFANKRQRGFARFSQFGDIICLSTTRNGNEDFLYIATLAAGMAACLLDCGYPVRGGIALGNLYHEDDIVVGEALDKALRLESTLAKHPRIIFDPSIPMSSSPAPWSVKDDDGCIYLDYLDAGLLDMYNQLVLSRFDNVGDVVQQDFQIPVEYWQSFVPEFVIGRGNQLPAEYLWLKNYLETRTQKRRDPK